MRNVGGGNIERGQFFQIAYKLSELPVRSALDDVLLYLLLLF
jgi:hypothetical protein